MTAGFSSRYIVGLLGVLLIIVGVPAKFGDMVDYPVSYREFDWGGNAVDLLSDC